MKRFFARMIVSAAIGALVASAILYVAVERALGRLDESVAALSSDMSDLRAATDALSQELGATAERVDTRLATLEARLDGAADQPAQGAEGRAEAAARIAAILAEADALPPERREEIRALLDTLAASGAAPRPAAGELPPGRPDDAPAANQPAADEGAQRFEAPSGAQAPSPSAAEPAAEEVAPR